MQEEYRIIKDYPNYSVSNFGHVKNDKTGKILKQVNDGNGYYIVSLCKENKRTNCRIHKLVANAFLPNFENKKCIDHIDNNPSNNNIDNLRWATNSENSQNTKISSKNTSGIKGVDWYKKLNKWRAQITIDGKTKHLGYYETLEEAKKARQEYANKIFGEYTNTCEKIINININGNINGNLQLNLNLNNEQN